MSQRLIEFRTEMEEALSWRINEYTHLKNAIKDDNKIAGTKVLIVMLYAHLEGFYKDCMECYIKLINQSDYTLNQMNESLITASLAKQFSSFEDMNRKCKELTSVPPKEDFLHKFHRRKELTKVFKSDYISRKVRIKDSIINTKSNLMFSVWQENFYILGLDEKYFQDYQCHIDKLVNLRNSVAHGSQRDPIEFSEFEILQTKIIELMENLIIYLYQYAYDQLYLAIPNRNT